MTPTVRLCVQGCDGPTEARVRYAFSAYGAWYGFRVVADGPADVTVGYGGTAADADVVLPATYRRRAAHVPAPTPVWVDGMPCFHPTDTGPDVLGEVFEWIAAPHEAACTDLDALGRVPPHHTLGGTHGIDRTVPWADRWLARLHVAVRTALPRLPARPVSPFGSSRTFVTSHDLDHLSADRLTNARRLAKNVAIALLVRHDPATATQIAVRAATRTATGRPTTSGLQELLRGEAQRGVRASYAVVAESTHRRDPGYTLTQDVVRHALDAIGAGGHEVCVHGSIESLTTTGQLAREYRLLAEAGFPATGGRQHWLRYHGRELFGALDAIGARWDSSVGHPDDIGFRRGVSFPFLPYDLDAERPHGVMEIPLIIMERALCRTTTDPAGWGRAAVDLLRRAEEHGWGGSAVLWHDYAFTGTTLPRGLVDAYWETIGHGDRWVTGREMAAAMHALGGGRRRRDGLAAGRP